MPSLQDKVLLLPRSPSWGRFWEWPAFPKTMIKNDGKNLIFLKNVYGSVCPIFQTYVTPALQILLEIIYTVKLQKSYVSRVQMEY